MESTCYQEQQILFNELTQGRELVKQLRFHLDSWFPSSSMGEMLITRLLSSFEKSLLMLNWVKFEGEPHKLSRTTAVTATECAVKEREYDSNLIYKSKKRRIVPRWTEEVRVCPRTGLQGPLDDAYSWRKYGQKDILGAKYPRGYYRCTYRNIQECLAIKQVQRSDEDPTIFHVTYRGQHTCIQASHVIPGQSPNRQNQNKRQKNSEEIFIDFRTGTEVKTEGFDTKEFTSSFVSFPSTSPIGCFEKENHIFISSLAPDNHFMGNVSPPSISPTTFESKYLSPYEMNSFGAQHFQTSESNLNAIASAAPFTSNSPILDLDLDFPVHFDSDFLSDILAS